MNTITITKTLYKFDELPTEAQAKALEKQRNINVNHDFWQEYVLDDAEGKLEECGYTGAKISYSGFWSQGDGASFTADVDIKTWLKAHKLAAKYRTLYNHADDCYMRINQSGHYYHEYTMSVDYGNEAYGIATATYQLLSEQLDTVAELVTEDARAEAKAIYRQLEAEFEYQITDDAVKDTLLANDYDFNEDGSLA